MDKKIQENADALYVQALQSISSDRTSQSHHLERDLASRNVANSGIVQGSRLKLEAAVVGRQMSARLESFKQAFQNAGAQPTPDDLQQIWQSVKEVHQSGIGRIWHQAEQHSIRTGTPTGSPERAGDALAQEHDRVLADWQVWRTEVGLAGAGPSFSASSRALNLSELPRREGLLDDLRHLLNNEPTGAAVIFIDLDHFKALNDTCGHPSGDKCLERIAEIIGTVVLHKGRLYRYGGDEFAVILPNTDDAESRATAERIRRTIDAENPGGAVKVTASIGAVVADKARYKTAEDTVKAADEAMYAAKQKRNAVSCG